MFLYMSRGGEPPISIDFIGLLDSIYINTVKSVNYEYIKYMEIGKIGGYVKTFTTFTLLHRFRIYICFFFKPVARIQKIGLLVSKL